MGGLFFEEWRFACVEFSEWEDGFEACPMRWEGGTLEFLSCIRWSRKLIKERFFLAQNHSFHPAHQNAFQSPAMRRLSLHQIEANLKGKMGVKTPNP